MPVVDVDEPLVTLTQLVNHMSGVSLTSTQAAAADVILQGVARGLERELNRSFGLYLVTEHLHTSVDGVLTFTRRPVLEVLDVQLDDPSWPTAGPVGFVASAYGRGVELGEHFANAWFTVSYHGGTPLSMMEPSDLADVRLAILEKASTIVGVRHDDSMTVKDLDTKDETVQGAEMHWTHAEIEHLGRLRRRVVAR